MPKNKSQTAKTAYKKIHLYVEEELYNKIWTIVKKRFVSPTRKFYIIVNEALREYVENHKHELEG